MCCIGWVIEILSKFFFVSARNGILFFFYMSTAAGLTVPLSGTNFGEFSTSWVISRQKRHECWPLNA